MSPIARKLAASGVSSVSDTLQVPGAAGWNLQRFNLQRV
jgi:hypothetical protein